ncbi:glycine-rich RNA-binding protein 4, mitochondrial-like isoform X1 [Amaranthus tricolor]|uniref:glycine-rich RNA-binding protein 4, mitochondrial-like isoform X1 n=1 Tax=Amaranthus tricolor TaxID=29722 RepID=UPI002583DC6C|nr:glycine-rich RNA-binding protein 4, mitochondrial-like isoform X1 [Amaranthus tricolor]
MAALIRSMIKSSTFIISSRAIPNPLPSSLLSRRGIASKLFIGGLSFYTTEKTLSEAFSQYGQVIQGKVLTLYFSLVRLTSYLMMVMVYCVCLTAQVLQDHVSKCSKGFGFVTYASEDEADKALTEMNGKVCLLYFKLLYVSI